MKEKIQETQDKYMASVIIPAYNCGNYIGRCLQSLAEQKTDLSYEVIVIDDGSTDDTEKICASFQDKIEHFTYLYKRNTGVSDTRNAGIERAQGKYIVLADADDFVADCYLEAIVGTAGTEDTEFVAAGYQIVYERTGNVIHNGFLQKEIFRGNLLAGIHVLGSDGLLNVGFSKCYLRKILMEHQIRFLTELQTGEDLVFNVAYLKKIRSMAVVTELPYYYIRRDIVSGVNSYKKNLYKMTQICLDAVADLYEKQQSDGRSREILGNFYLDYIGTGIYNLYRPECHLTFREKTKEIETYIGLDKNRLIAFSSRNDKLSKLLRYFLRLGNAKAINVSYTLLFALRNHFRTGYICFRNRCIFKNQKMQKINKIRGRYG